MQVFGYLHEAWDKIGFTHGDLNCANVMEHRGDADLYLPAGFANDQETQMFKLPGMLVIPQRHWSCCTCYVAHVEMNRVSYMHIYAPFFACIKTKDHKHGKTGTHVCNLFSIHMLVGQCCFAMAD